jgi:hypothetical protein
VIAVCFAYAFGLNLFRPKWYRAETTLAFKNRTNQEQLNATSLSENPLPIFLEQAPVEQQYDLSNILYSTNMAQRVIGDRLDQLYDPSKYDGLTDFYKTFLSQLGYEYDGERNILKLTFTYKDPELASEFCNEFGTCLEDFLSGIVDKSHVSPVLEARLSTALQQANDAQAEVDRITREYNVPDLLEAPKEWVKAYTRALSRSYISDAETQSIIAAMGQIGRNRDQRDLLSEPTAAPDTTILRDIILAGLRFKLAMVNAQRDIAAETTSPDSSAMQQLNYESANLTQYMQQQYSMGLDVESETLLLELQKNLVTNYLYKARAESTYERLEQLPELEAAIRPSIRAANVANATVATLQKLVAMVEVGEEYGVHPVQIVDAALVPTHPIQPAWKTLEYLLPLMLFLATIWFGLVYHSEEIMARAKAENNISDHEEGNYEKISGGV